jgi:hypothetical protein
MALATTTPAGAPDASRAADRKTLSAMLWALATWAFVYLVLQGRDGFFAVTVDRIESPWLASTFLNIPLQLALAFVVGACATAGTPRALRVGLWVGGIDLALVVGHFILSVLTA